MLMDTSGRRGEHGGRVYGVRWQRALLDFGRARGGERAARREEVQRVEGGCVAPSGGSSGVQASRRWPARARARRAHALLPTGRRLKTVATAVGWAAQCWTSTGAGPALVGCTGEAR